VNRHFALALVGVMLLVVSGQSVQLRGTQSQPVTEIVLHESRLVPFLQEIRSDSPNTYDSILLNIQRLRDGQAQGQAIELEEAVIAEQLMARLTGQTPMSSVTGAGALPKLP
jgi:hypothetical protein